MKIVRLPAPFSPAQTGWLVYRQPVLVRSPSPGASAVRKAFDMLVHQSVTPSPKLHFMSSIENRFICRCIGHPIHGFCADDCGHGVASCGPGDGGENLDAPSGTVNLPVSTGIMPALPSVLGDGQQLDGTIRQLQDVISTLGSPYTEMFAATADAEHPLEFLEAVIDCAKSAKSAVQNSTVELSSSTPSQRLHLQVCRCTCPKLSNASQPMPKSILPAQILFQRSAWSRLVSIAAATSWEIPWASLKTFYAHSLLIRDCSQ